MDVLALVVGQLQTNCYIVIDRYSSHGLIIDPGDDADYIMRILSDKKIKPKMVLATHGHFDHLTAVFELQTAFKIPFLIHEKDSFLLDRMNKTAKYFTGISSGPKPKINSFLNNKQKIKLEKNDFEVMETPGHTPGSVSFYNKKEGLIFLGDLIFAGGGVGRTDFSYSSFSGLQKSITKILKLPKNTKIYSGHGPETTIAIEIINLKRYFL